tara:strand:- start:571 stop:696 length:126 start_codon:yes stop_codon:yes gene_type:complete
MDTCPECGGDGQVEVATAADCFRDEDCEKCDGTGKIEREAA